MNTKYRKYEKEIRIELLNFTVYNLICTVDKRSEYNPVQYHLNVKRFKIVSPYSNCITSKLNSRVFSLM